MWSAVEKSCSPFTAPIRSSLSRSELLYFSFSDVTGFYRLSPYFFTDNVLRAPAIWGRGFDFPNKDEAKRSPAELLPAPWTPVTYPSSRVAEISTPIGPQMLPQSNSPKDIYLLFCCVACWHWMYDHIHIVLTSAQKVAITKRKRLPTSPSTQLPTTYI